MKPDKVQNINSYKFLELLKPNYSDAVKYSAALCSRRSKDDAKDLLQQSLLQALEKFYSLSDIEKFRSWLFKIITNVYLSSIRGGFWKKFISLDKKHESFPVEIDIQKKSETTDILMKALNLVSDKEKSAILLYEIAGFSIKEIADMQDEKSESAVKSRLSRTRSKLREYILKFEADKDIRNEESKKENFSTIEDETDSIISKTKEK